MTLSDRQKKRTAGAKKKNGGKFPMHLFKKFLSAAVSLLMIMGVFTGSFSGITEITITASADESEEIEESKDNTPKEDYHRWKQFDDRWGNMSLGGGVYNTMTAIGCLVGSICIAAVDCGAKSVDNFSPATFINQMNSVGGFGSYGELLSYKQVSQLIPGFEVINNYGYKSSTKAGKAAEMKYWMDQGYYIICHTKYYMDANGYWQSHFVYIEDIDGEYVKMNDPGSWSEDMFGTYWYKFAADYLVIKGPDSPDTYTEPPASYKPEIALDLLYYPNKTVYRIGEPLNLAGGVGIVTGINPDSGYYWILHAENMGNAHSFATYTSEFDSSKAGYYNIYFCAELYGLQAWQSIEVVVLDENGNYPPRDEEVTEESDESEETTQPDENTEENPPVTSTRRTTEYSEETTTTVADEYYFSGEGDLDVYSAPDNTDEPVASIPNGYVFKVFDIYDAYGKIYLEGNEVWVDTSILDKADNSESYEKGDINNDGVIDICDLSLLNDYLDSLGNSPEEISLLTVGQLEAADINSDGIIDKKDIISYISEICI